MHYTDTHAHLALLKEPHTVVSALFEAGFGNILDIGTEFDDLPSRVKEFSRYPLVKFAGGIWPSSESIENRESRVAVLKTCLESVPRSLIAAIGECGLDHHEEPDKDLKGERELFEAQLDIARDWALPIIVHSRDAPAETLEIINAHRGVAGIIHCYSYGVSEARLFLDAGFYISFAGNITYKKSDALRETVRFVPDDRLLLETDSPFLAPASKRGSPCAPAMIAETYALTATLRGITEDALCALVDENARRLLFR